MMLTRRLLCLGLVGASAGCGSLVDLPGKGAGPDLYSLRGAVPPRAATPGSPMRIQVTVAEPTADRALDTDRIALAPVERRIDYYAGAKWTDRAPALLQNLLLAGLDNSGRLKALARPGGLAGEVTVTGDLQHFEANGTSRPEIQIAWRLTLVEQPSGRVLDARLFEGRAAASGNDVASVVAGFESALKPVLADASTWVLNRLEVLKP